jgi:malonyl-CoA O-methyltransferase
MWTTFTDKVRKAFTDAADQYDILTSLHKEIGREMVKKTVKLDADRILDVGCGTGYVANKAKFFYPESTIIGLDLAEGMLIKAKELHEGVPIEWLQADAVRLPFKDQTFQLVLSNLAYQWTVDLPASFKEVRRVLTPGGTFNMTMFGSRTCQELFASLKEVAPKIALQNLPSVDEVNYAFAKTGFKDKKIDYELIKVQFKDVWELLGWLKNIGSNNLSENPFLGRQTIEKLDHFYKANYPYNEGICASFEIIWAKSQI